jgi:hypothetical protein
VAHPLDVSVPVVLVDYRTPFFSSVCEHWPDGRSAKLYREEAHCRDIRQAAQPPVVNVSLPGVPGYFTGTAGQAVVAYVQGPAPEMTGGFAVIPPESLS